MIEIKIIKISMFPICRSSVHSQGAVPTASTIRHLPLLELVCERKQSVLW